MLPTPTPIFSLFKHSTLLFSCLCSTKLRGNFERKNKRNQTEKVEREHESVLSSTEQARKIGEWGGPWFFQPFSINKWEKKVKLKIIKGRRRHPHGFCCRDFVAYVQDDQKVLMGVLSFILPPTWLPAFVKASWYLQVGSPISTREWATWGPRWLPWWKTITMWK